MNFSPIGGRVRLTRVLQAELIILGTLIGVKDGWFRVQAFRAFAFI
jgi:hypothetical protein